MSLPLTQQRVKELLDYREDGALLWKVAIGQRAKPGNVAGCIRNKKGYWSIKVDGRRYSRHRLVFLWHTGYMPENIVDHINRNNADDRIENLREVAHVCNCRNAKQRTSVSGVKGVSWHYVDKVWVATVCVHSKNRRVGFSADFLEAVCHRLAAEQYLDWPGCDACSPAAQYVRNHLGVATK